MRERTRTHRRAIAVVAAAVAVIVTVSGCGNELIDLDEIEPQVYTVSFDRQGGFGGVHGGDGEPWLADAAGSGSYTERVRVRRLLQRYWRQRHAVLHRVHGERPRLGHTV